MAIIKDIKLSVLKERGYTSPYEGPVDISVAVTFSEAEIRLGLNYRVHVALLERDGGRDHSIIYTNGVVRSISPGNDDDFVAWIPSKQINPNGKSEHIVWFSYSLYDDRGNPKAPLLRIQKEEWDKPGQKIELYPVAHIASELSPATSYGPMESVLLT